MTMTIYKKSLYTDTDTYLCHVFKNREEWLSARHSLHGIGGSDASAAVGKSPWRSNIDLWQIKTGRKDAPDISDSERVQSGILEEEPIRRLFQAETRDKYEVQYVEDAILQNKKHRELLYSPDGLLIEKETGRKGILEIKTTEIMKSFDREKWGTKESPRIPDNYYVQILHGMNVTGFDFVILYARLKYPDGGLTFRSPDTYMINRTDDGVQEDLDWIRDGVLKFYGYVKRDEEPPMMTDINF